VPRGAVIEERFMIKDSHDAASDQPKTAAPQPSQDTRTLWWTKQLDDIDREILRLATICDAHVLQPGVVDRIIKNDSSVCGSPNPRAFEKLRLAVMVHYAVFDKSAAMLGGSQTAAIVKTIVARLAAAAGRPLPPGLQSSSDAKPLDA
jgi:hypothetical protein